MRQRIDGGRADRAGPATLGDADVVAVLARFVAAESFDAAASGVLGALAAAAGVRRATMLALEGPGVVRAAHAGHDEAPDAWRAELGVGHAVDALLDAAEATTFAAGSEEPRLPYERGVAFPIRAGNGARAGAVLLDGATEDAARGGDCARLLALLGPALARRRAEGVLSRRAAALDEQQVMLTALIEALPDPIVVTDDARALLTRNRRADVLLSAADDATPDRRRVAAANRARLCTLLEDGALDETLDLELEDPEGGPALSMEVIARALPASAARPGARVCALRDVTALRRGAEELRRQVELVRRAELEATRERDRLNLILENVGDPILVSDASSRLVLMNREAEQLFDVGGDEAAATGDGGAARPRAAVRGNDTKFTAVIAGFAAGAERTLRTQLRLRHPRSGTEFPVEVVSGKVCDERGATVAVVSVLHDLTRQVENETLYDALKRLYGELEERVRSATADLAEQNAQLQWQAQELEKANRLKSDFLASMSHELRTPINALIGYASLMLDRLFGDLTEKQEEGLRRMQSSAQHLLELINDILDLARIEAGRMPVHVDDVRLADVVEEIAEQVEPLVQKKRLAFERRVPADAPVLRTDRLKVKQILINLLSNAVKFTEVGGVTLTAACDAAGATIVVADTGIGIAPEDRAAIWEDFRQVDQSRTREYGGTGLGLSITKKLCAALGGTVEVESEVGRGSTFTVWLPANAPVQADAPPPARRAGDGDGPRAAD